MSKLTSKAKKPDTSDKNKEFKVTNFMSGTSFKLSAMETLRIVTTSSIFGEPQYYKDGDRAPRTIKNVLTARQYSIFNNLYDDGKTTADVMVEVINNALNENFNEVMEFAVELRNNFYMRLNPSIMLALAAIHPKRKEFTTTYPGKFTETVKKVARRPDDLTSMIEYHIASTGDKKGIPSVLKRAVAKKLAEFDQYQISKYQTKGIGLIDVIRITHPKGNEFITKLIKDGSLPMPEDKATWRQLRSSGMKWKDILSKHFSDLTHFDLVNQLRSIFQEVEDTDAARAVMDNLISGVEKGKLFPYRYFAAREAIIGADVHHKAVLMDGLEEAMDVAINNLPRLKGKTMCLSDNSGSAWGALTFEGATTKIAEIGNLSSVITGILSDEGYIGKFGDRLIVHPVSKRNGALSQAKNISTNGSSDVGGGTENGIWLFFDKAIQKKEHWDNIFIYSDMQAGHGGLYGTDPKEYKMFSCEDSRFIDVMKLIDAYRKRVNKKVNVFSVQTAGYNNSVTPEHIYRGAILGGWTGSESLFASKLIEEWNNIEENNKQQPNQ